MEARAAAAPPGVADGVSALTAAAGAAGAAEPPLKTAFLAGSVLLFGFVCSYFVRGRERA